MNVFPTDFGNFWRYSNLIGWSVLNRVYILGKMKVTSHKYCQKCNAQDIILDTWCRNYHVKVSIKTSYYYWLYYSIEPPYQFLIKISLFEFLSHAGRAFEKVLSNLCWWLRLSTLQYGQYNITSFKINFEVAWDDLSLIIWVLCHIRLCP